MQLRNIKQINTWNNKIENMLQRFSCNLQCLLFFSDSTFIWWEFCLLFQSKISFLLMLNLPSANLFCFIKILSLKCQIPKFVFFANFSCLNIYREFLPNIFINCLTTLFTHLWNQNHCRFTSSCWIMLTRSSLNFLFDGNSISLSKFSWNYVLSHVYAWM